MYVAPPSTTLLLANVTNPIVLFSYPIPYYSHAKQKHSNNIQWEAETDKVLFDTVRSSDDLQHPANFRFIFLNQASGLFHASVSANWASASFRKDGAQTFLSAWKRYVNAHQMVSTKKKCMNNSKKQGIISS